MGEAWVQGRGIWAKFDLFSTQTTKVTYTSIRYVSWKQHSHDLTESQKTEPEFCTILKARACKGTLSMPTL
jgi:GH43 family beta-xylosidase